jgi:hypothetical protein
MAQGNCTVKRSSLLGEEIFAYASHYKSLGDLSGVGDTLAGCKSSVKSFEHPMNVSHASDALYNRLEVNQAANSL